MKQCIKGEGVSFKPNCKLLGVGIAEGSQQTCHKEEELYRVQDRVQVKDGRTKILVGQGETVAVARVAAELKVKICQFV